MLNDSSPRCFAVGVVDRCVALEIGEAVECHKLRDVFPYLGVVGVENVRAVLVDVDALHILGIDISGNVRALVNDKNILAGFFRFVGEDSP